jgi:hypothetical protein
MLEAGARMITGEESFYVFVEDKPFALSLYTSMILS